MPITSYNVLTIIFITTVTLFSLVVMISVEDFYRSRRTKLTHPHHIHHKHYSEEQKLLPTKSYVYSRLSKKHKPAHIKDKLVEQGWSEAEAHDAVRHYTEQYLQEKAKNKGKEPGTPKILFRKK